MRPYYQPLASYFAEEAFKELLKDPANHCDCIESDNQCPRCMGFGVRICRRLQLTDAFLIEHTRYPDDTLKPTTNATDAIKLVEWVTGFWGAITINGNLDNMGHMPSWHVRASAGWNVRSQAYGWTICEALCRLCYYMVSSLDQEDVEIDWELNDLDDLQERP